MEVLKKNNVRAVQPLVEVSRANIGPTPKRFRRSTPCKIAHPLTSDDFSQTLVFSSFQFVHLFYGRVEFVFLNEYCSE